MAAYENYKVWLKGLSNKELNEEVLKNMRNMNTSTGRAARAWRLMHEASKSEMTRRDQ